MEVTGCTVVVVAMVVVTVMVVGMLVRMRMPVRAGQMGRFFG
ncbi:MAG: hypothetical protein AAF998_12995 [Bacteroidota bacterium]